MGLEPTTFGTTIRRSNLLSYNHHLCDTKWLHEHWAGNHFYKAMQIYKSSGNLEFYTLFFQESGRTKVHPLQQYYPCIITPALLAEWVS